MPPEDPPPGSGPSPANGEDPPADAENPGAPPAAGRDREHPDGGSLPAGEGADQVVPVILPGRKEGDPDLSSIGEGWRRGAAVLVLALLPVAIYAAWDRGWLDLQGGTTAEAAAEARRSERRGLRNRFDRMADSVADAVREYGERRSDFEKDRIGCAALGTGYASVDRSFVELSLLYRERRDEIASSQAQRYESLVEDVNGVNRHYDGSGCRTGGG